MRQTLASLGANADQLIARGLGSRDPWHIPGVGTEGALAAQNRKVVLIDAVYESNYPPL